VSPARAKSGGGKWRTKSRFSATTVLPAVSLFLNIGAVRVVGDDGQRATSASGVASVPSSLPTAILAISLCFGVSVCGSSRLRLCFSLAREQFANGLQTGRTAATTCAPIQCDACYGAWLLRLRDVGRGLFWRNARGSRACSVYGDRRSRMVGMGDRHHAVRSLRGSGYPLARFWGDQAFHHLFRPPLVLWRQRRAEHANAQPTIQDPKGPIGPHRPLTFLAESREDGVSFAGPFGLSRFGNP
jgi:hypothetical protein